MKVVQIVSLSMYVLIFLNATSGIIQNKAETLIGEEDRRGTENVKKPKDMDQEKANTASRGLWAIGQVEKGQSGYQDGYDGQGGFPVAGPDNLGYSIGAVGLHGYNTRPLQGNDHGLGQEGYGHGHPTDSVGLNYGHSGGGAAYGYSDGGGLGYDHGSGGTGHGHSGGGIGYGHSGSGIGYGHGGSGIGYGHSGSGIGYGHSGTGIGYGQGGGGTDFAHSGGETGYGHKGGESIYGHSGGGLNYGHSGGALADVYGGGAYGGGAYGGGGFGGGGFEGGAFGGSGLGSFFGKKLPLKKLLLPIAGLALLGAAAALSTNPILLQLGTISGRKRRSISNRSSEEFYPGNPFVRPMRF